MSFFRRKQRADTAPSHTEREPSYAEEESNPELIAAEKAVNAMPSIPSSDGVFGVMFGQRPQIVDVPVDGVIQDDAVEKGADESSDEVESSEPAEQ